MAVKPLYEQVGFADELARNASPRLLVLIVFSLYCVYLYVNKALKFKVRLERRPCSLCF